MRFDTASHLKLLLSACIPILAALFQWGLWGKSPPLPWLFFYPAVFFSVWLSGLPGGLITTGLAVLLGRYFFIEPQFSLAIENSGNIYDLAVFIGVGVLCSLMVKPQSGLLSQENLTFRTGFLAAIFHSTSKQQNAAEALKNCEKEFYLLAESMPHAVWISDPNGLTTFINKKWAIFTGTTLEQNRGSQLHNLFHPDDQQTGWDAWREAVKNGIALNLECRVRCFDGIYRWCFILAEPVYDESHNIVKYFGTCTDIDDFKKVQTELHDAEARWKFALEGSDQGVWDWNIATSEVFFSSRWKSMLGFSDEEITNNLEEWSARVHPDDLEGVMLDIQKHFRGETPLYKNEHRMRNRDGEYQWILDRGKVVSRNDAGQALRMIGTHTDINERKHNEAALMEAQKLAKIGYWQWDIATNTHTWSEEIYHFYGRDTNSPPLVYPEVKQHFTPETWANLVATVEKAKVDGLPYECDVEVVRTDGSHGWIIARGQAVLDDAGHVIKLHGTLQDISSRKQAEEQLRKFAQAIEQIPDSIVITNLNAEIEYINEAFMQGNGYSREELIGKNLRMLQSGKTPKETYLALWNTLCQGQTWKGEFYNRRKDGTEYIDFAVITPLLQADGRVTHYVGVQENITEKIRIDTELEQYRDHLEELVRSRTAQLETAKALAETANLSKSVFLANMSHEIRTPMNAVLGFCYLLEQQPLEEDTRTLVSKIHNSGNLLLAIINEILDFSKIEAGHLEIEDVPFKLSDIFDHLATIMAGSTGNKNLELVIIPPVGTNALIGDGNRIQQVLVNLLSNAIKFTDQGEVQLKVSIDSDDGDQILLRFAVSDTGIGISSSKQQYIFTAFSQADNTISRRFGGSGLGLAISQQLIRLMGGEIHVESIIGQGSKFWFVLPLRRNPQPEHSPTQLTNLHLLVAVDNIIAREALLRIVHSLGWRADPAESGQAAISKTLENIDRQTPYDLLLLDWQMPELDGLAVAKAVHDVLPANGKQPESPPIVLMVTTHSREKLLAQPGIDKVDAILSKPVTLSSLYHAVVHALEQRDSTILPVSILNNQIIGQRIPGIRVLVVDDNDINREVMQRILEADGASVSLAKDGIEALEWLSIHADGVDIVLMDIQMPRMDGYTAARAIRQNPIFSKLPMVAITAGATSNFEDNALACGMNDFITKPFNVSDIMSLIQRLTGCKPETNCQKVDIDATKLMASESFRPKTNLAGINFEAGLKIWREVGVYQTYLSLFISQYRFASQEIIVNSEHGDRDASASLIHKLKGAAYMLALETVAQRSIDVETALNTGRSLANASAALQNAIEEVATSLSAWLSSESTAEKQHAAPATLPDETEKLLLLLLAALDEDNPGNAEQLLISIENLLGSEAIAPIKAQLQNFNFREAEALTLSLMHKLNVTSQ